MEKTLEQRVADLEARRLRREMPESIAAALEERPRTKQVPTKPVADKEQNRSAIWNMVQALPGWEKAPGGARYVGTRGIAMLTGRANAFLAGGTSAKSREFDTLEEAVEAAHRIGGAAKKRAVESADVDEGPDEGMVDRAHDAVATALGGSKEIVEQDGVTYQKRLVKVEIGVEDLATKVANRAREMMMEDEHMSEEEAMAQAVEELVPKLPGHPAKAEAPMPEAEEGEAPPEEPEAPPEEPEAPEEEEEPEEEDENKKLADQIATRTQELVESEGTPVEDAVRQAIQEVLDAAEAEKPEEPAAEEPAAEEPEVEKKVLKGTPEEIAKQMPQQLLDGLCEQIQGEEHPWQSCMDRDYGEFEPEDKEAFCAWLKNECGAGE